MGGSGDSVVGGVMVVSMVAGRKREVEMKIRCLFCQKIIHGSRPW